MFLFLQFNIEREKCVVFITSTTGDGDPPDTAAKFVRRLKKKTLSESYLSHLHYAMLGNVCSCSYSTSVTASTGQAFDTVN